MAHLKIKKNHSRVMWEYSKIINVVPRHRVVGEYGTYRSAPPPKLRKPEYNRLVSLVLKS